MSKLLKLLILSGLVVSSATASPVGAQADTTASARKVSIVQLGDSYSAGNGAGEYFGPPACQRSRLNWGQGFASSANGSAVSATYDNRACSGAVVKDVFQERTLGKQSAKGIRAGSVEEARAKLEAADACGVRGNADVASVEYNIQKNGSPWPWAKDYTYQCQLTLRPQADFVGPQTDLVLMTMGGNDVHFSDLVKQCFAPNIPGLFDGADAASCREKINSARTDMPKVMDQLKATIERLLSEKMAANPASKVVLMSYPLLSMDTSYVLDNDGVSVDAAREVRQLGTDAVALQQKLVDDLNASHPGRVLFVSDAPTAFAGHEPDPALMRENPKRWLNEFLEAEGDADDSGNTHARFSWTVTDFWHPNRAGHREMGNLVQRAHALDDAPPVGAASADVDVVIAIDSSEGSAPDAAAVKASMDDIVNRVGSATRSSRYAVVALPGNAAEKAAPGDGAVTVLSDFTEDPAALATAVDSVSSGAERDSGSSLTWRTGVRRVALVVGNAATSDTVRGLDSLHQQEASPLGGDAVQTHVITRDGKPSESRGDSTEATGGQVLVADSAAAVPDRMVDAVIESTNRPFAWLQGPYVAQAGDELTLDAQGSHATTGRIVAYEWDFDGDGVYDATTPEPVVTHRYETQITGKARIRVTDDNGLQSVGEAQLAVTRDGDVIPDEYDNCVDIANPDQQDQDNDGVGDACQDKSHFSAPDADR